MAKMSQSKEMFNRNEEIGHIQNDDIYKTLLVVLENGGMEEFKHCLSLLGQEKRNYYFGQKEFFEKYIRLLIKSGKYQEAVSVLKNCENLTDPVFLVLWDQTHYLWHQSYTDKPLTPIQRYRIRNRFPPPTSICPGGERPHIKIDYAARQILKTWFHQNINYPYPTITDKQALADQTRLSIKQISTWFGNARRRWKASHDWKIFSKPKQIDEDAARNCKTDTKLYQTNAESSKRTEAENTEDMTRQDEELPTHVNCQSTRNDTRMKKTIKAAAKCSESLAGIAMVTATSKQTMSTVRNNKRRKLPRHEIHIHDNLSEYDKALSAHKMCKHLTSHCKVNSYRQRSEVSDKIVPHNHPELNQLQSKNEDELDNAGVDHYKDSQSVRKKSVNDFNTYTRLSSSFDKLSKNLDNLNYLDNRLNDFEARERLKSFLGFKIRKGKEEQNVNYKPLTNDIIDAKKCFNDLRALCDKVERETVSPRDVAMNIVIQDINDHQGYSGGSSCDQSDRMGMDFARDSAALVEDMVIDVSSIGCVEVEVEDMSAVEMDFQCLLPWQSFVHNLTCDPQFCIQNTHGWMNSVQALNEVGSTVSKCSDDGTDPSRSTCTAVSLVPIGKPSSKPTSNGVHESLPQNVAMSWMDNVGCSREIQANSDATMDQPNQFCRYEQRIDRQISLELKDREDYPDCTNFKEPSLKARKLTNMNSKTSYSTVIGEAVEGLLNLSSSQELDTSTQSLETFNYNSQ